MNPCQVRVPRLIMLLTFGLFGLLTSAAFADSSIGPRIVACEALFSPSPSSIGSRSDIIDEIDRLRAQLKLPSHQRETKDPRRFAWLRSSEKNPVTFELQQKLVAEEQRLKEYDLHTEIIQNLTIVPGLFNRLPRVEPLVDVIVRDWVRYNYFILERGLKSGTHDMASLTKLSQQFNRFVLVLKDIARNPFAIVVLNRILQYEIETLGPSHEHAATFHKAESILMARAKVLTETGIDQMSSNFQKLMQGNGRIDRADESMAILVELTLPPYGERAETVLNLYEAQMNSNITSLQTAAHYNVENDRNVAEQTVVTYIYKRKAKEVALASRTLDFVMTDLPSYIDHGVVLRDAFAASPEGGVVTAADLYHAIQRHYLPNLNFSIPAF